MHRIGDLFSTRQDLRAGVLARLDPRVKFILALAAVLAVVLSTRIMLPLTVLGVALATLVGLRASPRATLHRLAAPLGLTAVVVVLRAFMTGTTPLVSLPLGAWELTATVEGVWSGALVGARVLASVSVLAVLCLIMPAAELFAALRWARVPRTWIEIAMLMYRYIFTLFDQAAAVVAAQRVRLGYAGFRRSLASMGSLAGIVTLRSIDQAEKTHEAMVARGYQGSLPIGHLPAMARRDMAILTAGAAAVLLAFVILERWPL
jgi:cobalt/nickel transport system permease protein